MALAGRCAISVDLDGIDCYYAIHGLGEPPLALRNVVLERALPRFLEALARRGVRATLFLIGRDAEASEAAVREAAAAGHEIANHSYSHPYDLLRLSPPEIEAEVRRGHEVLGGLAEAPVGFRSPGYTVSADLLASLERLGYLYDSSMFPAWPYYAAKAVVMTSMRVVGRRSAATLADPRALLCPTEPYRPDPARPWRRGDSSLVELPVAVTPWLRLPAIGTVLLAGPPSVRRHVLQAVRKRAFFNLEMHGIELCGAQEDEIPDALVTRQPDLRVPLAEKTRRFDELLEAVGRGRTFHTLREVAQTV